MESANAEIVSAVKSSSCQEQILANASEDLKINFEVLNQAALVLSYYANVRSES